VKTKSAALKARAFINIFARVVAAFVSSPFTYVFGFALAGAGSVVSGVYEIAGYGPAAIVAGFFLIAASSYITKGLKSNG
jgi:hypothetical protein